MMAPDDRNMDATLAALLAPPEGPGDRGFAAGVERAIDAQAAYARARRRFWRSFAFEALAVAALLAALSGTAHWGLAPPLLLILLLWFGTQRWRQT